MRFDLEKLDSFTLEMSKNHLIRSFLRNGRLRVKLRQLKPQDFLYCNSDLKLAFGQIAHYEQINSLTDQSSENLLKKPLI